MRESERVRREAEKQARAGGEKVSIEYVVEGDAQFEFAYELVQDVFRMIGVDPYKHEVYHDLSEMADEIQSKYVLIRRQWLDQVGCRMKVVEQEKE